MELEVVLKEDQSEAEGQAIAEDLMRRLDVREEALLEDAYMDLIEQTINQEQNAAH
jgi:adenylate cyclase class IV